MEVRKEEELGSLGDEKGEGEGELRAEFLRR